MFISSVFFSLVTSSPFVSLLPSLSDWNHTQASVGVTEHWAVSESGGAVDPPGEHTHRTGRLFTVIKNPWQHSYKHPVLMFFKSHYTDPVLLMLPQVDMRGEDRKTKEWRKKWQSDKEKLKHEEWGGGGCGGRQQVEMRRPCFQCVHSFRFSSYINGNAHNYLSRLSCHIY